MECQRKLALRLMRLRFGLSRLAPRCAVGRLDDLCFRGIPLRSNGSLD